MSKEEIRDHHKARIKQRDTPPKRKMPVIIHFYSPFQLVTQVDGSEMEITPPPTRAPRLRPLIVPQKGFSVYRWNKDTTKVLLYFPKSVL